MAVKEFNVPMIKLSPIRSYSLFQLSCLKEPYTLNFSGGFLSILEQ